MKITIKRVFQNLELVTGVASLSRVSGAILVLGVISIFSIWLPNKAAAGFCQDKSAQLKQSGWDVQSSVGIPSTSAYAKCNIVATKTDPKTGRTTRAKYDALGDGNDGYNYSTETTYKDGHKTSEEHDVIGSPYLPGSSDHKLSNSTTDPSGDKTTITYNMSGKDVKLTKFNARLNETTETDSKTGDVTIHTETGKASSTATTIHATGVTSTVTQGDDGTVYTHQTDSTGKIVGATIQKPGGPKEVITGNPDGSSFHETFDPNGKLISTQSCDKFSTCVNGPGDALAKPANLQADKTKKSQPTDQSKVGQTGDKSKMGQDQSKQGLAHNKQQTKADVLKQIGDKPSGDLKNANEKFKTDVLGKIKHNRGQAAGLNPQPLPPGSRPDKLIGKPKLDDKFTGVKPHFDDKFQTRGNKNLKQDFTKQAVTHGAKINEKVVPHSQSPSQFSQGNKHLPQNNLTEKYKAKSKPQNWNSSAASQGAVKKHPYKKPGSN